MSFVSFLKRNLACIRLGIASRITYPVDFFLGVTLIPIGFFLVEVVFWMGVINASGNNKLAGFSANYYISYFLYLLLQLGNVNWAFERAMISEINSGAVNALLLRPSSFFEYHLGQLLGQKLVTATMMTPLIFLIAWGWDLPFHGDRMPLVLLMGFCYEILLFSLHFSVASMAFFLDHVHSLNNTKSMIIWFLTGVLMPLDLFPSPLREWIIALPFSAGTYLPASYLSGRIERDYFFQGFVSLFIGAIFFGILARFVWKKGLKSYSGTGA